MNILASYNWVKEYLTQADSPEDSSKKMSASGMSVEFRHDLVPAFDHMVVGVIRAVEAHPKADRLRVVKTGVGTHGATIVCGGINLVSGQRVAVALPGSRVKWHGEGEFIVLETTTIRGVESEGMICAPEEIGFEKLVQKSDQPLIWDISSLTDAPAGTPLVQALGLEDTIFDIEVTTNRPDAMSIIGLAREAGAVEAGTFQWSSLNLPQERIGEELPLDVQIQETTRCLRYQAIVLDGVRVSPSPWWLQARLLLSGHRPINNIVDITNYVLQEYGQPLHAFDYDTLTDGTVVVRSAEEHETMKALDGNTYTLSPEHLVIADAKRAVAVAGVMGGEETGVSERTTRIVFECASFDPVSVRRTARALSLYSDSQLVFEKGLSTEATTPALARAVALALELGGGRVASRVVDIRSAPSVPLHFVYDPRVVNARIGIEVSEIEQVRIMESLGFTLTQQSEGVYDAEVPYWRDHDIEDPVDFSEEIARVYGYHRLPAVLPGGREAPLPETTSLQVQDRMKRALSSAGATELYHYAFTSREDLDAWEEFPREALRFLNPLADDQAFLRVSLVPSVLRSIERNQGITSSALVFELANVYIPQSGDLPSEDPHCVIAGYGDEWNDLRVMRGVLERLFEDLGIRDYTLRTEEGSTQWHPGRHAQIVVAGEVVGMIGEVARDRQKSFGVQGRVAAIELNVNQVIPFITTSKRFVPVSEFPSVKRDVACVIDRLIPYELLRTKLSGAHPLLVNMEPFDVYEGQGISEGKKSLALHLVFQSHERTLTAEEVELALSTVVGVLKNEFSATIRT